MAPPPWSIISRMTCLHPEEGGGGPAPGPDRVHRHGQGVRVAVDQLQAGALAGEQDRLGAAVAPAGADAAGSWWESNS